MSELYAVLLSGGAGTRLWPRSRRSRPKQFLDLVGPRSLFGETVARIAPLVPLQRMLVVAPSEHAGLVGKELPDLPGPNFVAEPYPRGNAAAIGLAIAAVAARDPEATLAVLPSDHVVEDAKRFRGLLETARGAAEAGYLVTLGVRATGPDTGFGYIERTDEPVAPGAFVVRRFVEKPKRELAEEMFRSGHHLWNAGIFVFSLPRVLDEYARQLPGTARAIAALREAAGTDRWKGVLAEVWEETEKTTFDYGIMEKAERVAVVPAEVGWHDVGTWARLAEIVGSSDNQDPGRLLSHGSRGLYVYSPWKVVAAVGVEDLIIVDTPDALLVCRKDRAEEVKAVVERLQHEGRTELL